ncbi:hypothetical protein FC52_GL000568 [Lactobacillus pasteurii DSM 23907 = CRBIP 24.76]|uniref:Uncharacterized protein n=1 Tax=Lactobacillus pasteurii DSM 23907 = CRBIP 24.76 TaxID=1423790 RepID=I7LEQ6_9LACO|nr:hypothetical protein [Lactobacillus pasteurii]KRK08867.1 hypothetical protein FC52_GL000568 [Lactobacillus pasteurii DSM 23907 = CRBIP 24.76]TDG76298.1 hypothetical protein C5L33_001057 [Lactobacillus pasteurii]CCI85978.1 Protein of unknown function [Lactobacillus pasteurii DSM 23907 = CRBIP 24.76]
MKKYRLSNKQIAIGIGLMAVGLVLWFLAVFTYSQLKLAWLIPIGIILICCGGLELTVLSLIYLHKNDQEARKAIKEAELAREKENQNQKTIRKDSSDGF